MNEVISGDLLKDNDLRMDGRVVMVVAVEDARVLAVDTTTCRRCKISKKRIFLDGKDRRYGFNVLLDKRMKK